ncbi:MAG: metal ABC transporter permease [Alphaproteobacteria bacterium]
MTWFLDIFQYDFIMRAIVSGVFIATACATLGIFLVLRNLSLISDGLSHIGFGTIAIGLFLGIAPPYFSLPLLIIASLLIMRLKEQGTTSGDAAIGIISAVGIASGIVFAKLNRGINIDVVGYLFGNILTITPLEMWLSIFLSLAIMAVVYFFYWDFFATTFDNIYARAIGIRTIFINRLLMVLTAMLVVLSIRLVGSLLVSALIIFPAITALRISKRFKSALFISLAIAIISVICGMGLAFLLNLPSGAMIVITNSIFFLASLFYKKT